MINEVKYEVENTYIICKNQQEQNEVAHKLIALGFLPYYFKIDAFNELPIIQVHTFNFGNYKVVNKINASCAGMITPIKELHISDFNIL